MRIGPFGVWEILIILVVVLLIFGPRRLPEMAKGLGQSVRAFRKELRDMRSDLDGDDEPRAANKANPSKTSSAGAASAPADGAGATADTGPRPGAPAADDDAVRDGASPRGGGTAAT